jgi:ATP-binding cassette, subfamily B, bacterial MsbA
MTTKPNRVISASVGGLIGITAGQRWLFAAAAACMGVSALATAGYAYLVGPVLRSLFLGSANEPKIPIGAGTLEQISKLLDKSDIGTISLAIVIAASIKGAAFFGQTILAGRAGSNVLHDLRLRLYHGLLKINPLSKEARSRGDLIARFTIDIEEVEKAIAKGLVAFVRDGMQILTLAALALMLDPLLGIVGLVAFPPIAVLIIRIGKRLRQRRAKVHEAFGSLGNIVEETAVSLPVIRAFNAEKMLLDRFSLRSKKILTSTVRAIATRAFSSPLNEILGAAALAITLWYARDRINSQALTPEAFISFFTALLLLYQPVKGLGQAQHAVQAGLAALERLAPFTKTENAPATDPFAKKAFDKNVEVVLNNVSTGYEKETDVLTGLDLTIVPGSRTAVVGVSGAGKSTLLNLLQGFLPIRMGQITIGGKPIEKSETMPRLFAPVPQEPHLFDDTIRTNVRCGRPDADNYEIEEACKAAGVAKFADQMERGLDTQIGPDGTNLSVGQRQRVCLARALVSLAPILLLDEVTASLDGQTEEALVTSLDEFLAGRTVLVVTHRLATARWADNLVLLEDGKAALRGPSIQLIEDDERLVRLFGNQ